MKVAVLEPKKDLEIREIETSLKQYQQVVDGYIELVSIDWKSNLMMVCDEEGKLNGKVPNFKLKNDIIVGTVFFTDITEDGELTDLSDDNIEFLRKAFNGRTI